MGELTSLPNIAEKLEGAKQGVRWHDLGDETKKELKEFFNIHKA